MDRLFFLHIPKTGGSSLSAALSKKFASWEVFPWHHARLDLLNSNDLLPFRFFSGHFAITDLAYVPRPAKSITLIREPQSRIVSLYNYWRSFKSDVVSKHEPHHAHITKTVGLKSFLTLPNPSLRVTIDNGLVRGYLPYPLRGRNNEWSASPETLLDDALQTLDRFTVFGLMEKFGDSVRAVGAALGSSLALPAAKVRSFEQLHTSHLHELVDQQLATPEIEGLLGQLTELDRIFYNRALKLFQDKFAKHLPPVTADESGPCRDIPYEWGDWINFGADYHLDGLVMDGWGQQEEWGVWSVTAEPAIRIGPLRRATGTIRLAFVVRAAVFDREHRQRVAVVLNGQEIERWDFDLESEREKTARVLAFPASAIDEAGFLNLAFRIERPLSPKAAGLSDDPRELGIGLENIHLECMTG